MKAQLGLEGWEGLWIETEASLGERHVITGIFLENKVLPLLPKKVLRQKAGRKQAMITHLQRMPSLAWHLL